MTSIINSLFKSPKNADNKVQKDENLPNIFVEDGIAKVRSIKKLSCQQLIEIVGYLIIERYILLIKESISKHNKKLPWDHVTHIYIHNNFVDEFLWRSSRQTSVDLNSLRPYINKLKRPYTLSIIGRSISVNFIFNSVDESLSESEQQKHFSSMYNHMVTLIEESIISRGVGSVDAQNDNTTDKIADESNENSDEKEVLLEMSLRQRKA
jgi:hypothetical protein